MKIKRIVTVYFSPTGGTKKISSILANDLGQFLNLSIEEIDFTLPPARTKKYHFSAEDLLISSYSRSVLYTTERGRYPGKISESKTANEFRSLQSLWNLRECMSDGKYYR